MRKQIESKKYGAVVVIFITLIMILSTIGFLYSGNTQNSTTVEGRKYFITDKGWLLTLEGKKHYFQYLPNEIEGIQPEVSAAMRNSPMIYVTYDPEDENKAAISQLQFEVGEALRDRNVYVQNAFTKENTYNLPIITCDNATAGIPVMEIGTAENLSVSMNNGCIKAQSATSDFLRLRDTIMYAVLGII